ncbi:MAG: hypothetical protein IIC12_02410 [Proteobacteria bacterium]|nr:hypothetical protein [Pseudomonadota bacterium]
MNKTTLQDQLRKADIAFDSKATKAELEKLLADSQPPAPTKSKANGRAKGAKAVLREKFKKAGVVTAGQIDKIAEKLSVTRSTVLTAMSDLKNEKYAGKAGPLNIQKDDDGYRLAK